MFHKRISALILLILPLFIYAPARAETAALNADMQEHARSNAKISIQTSQPYGLFYKTDAKSITLFFDNIKGDVGSISIDMTCKNAWGNAQSFFPKSITLNAANHYRNRIDLADVPFGAYSVDCAPSFEGKALNPATVYFAVIPNNYVKKREPNSPFGVNTHFGQRWDPALARIPRKAGIAWIRDGGPECEGGKAAAAQNLCFFMTIDWYPRPPAECWKGGDSGAKDNPDNWDFSSIATVIKDFTAKYGKYIDAIDIQNEPNSGWASTIGGSWNGGPWIPVFSKFGRQVSQATRESAPHIKIAWEDCDVFVWYKALTANGGGKYMDILSPHTYNWHPEIPYPEEQPALSQYRDVLTFLAARNPKCSVWVGECGYSSFTLNTNTNPTNYTPCTETTQASLLVRKYVLELSHGTKKIFWYDLKNDWGKSKYDPEDNFGLTHSDGYPKPSIVAYATLIDKLKGAHSLGAWPIGGGGDAYVFAADAKKPVLIAWIRNGGHPEAFYVTSNVKEVTITDIFGGTTTRKVENHRLMLDLSESPVYVTGLTMRDLNK